VSKKEVIEGICRKNDGYIVYDSFLLSIHFRLWNLFLNLLLRFTST